jgi:hypothetical protein
MLVKLMCIGRVLPVQGPVNALRAMLDTSLMQQVTADQAKQPIEEKMLPEHRSVSKYRNSSTDGTQQ